MFKTAILFGLVGFFPEMDSSISVMNLHLTSVPSAAALFYLALIAVVAYFICICLYNCFFHPLAGFLGPWLCAMSEWFLVVFIQAVPTYGLELHKRYGGYGLDLVNLKNCLIVCSIGPFIRLAPNMLSFSDATLLHIS